MSRQEDNWARNLLNAIKSENSKEIDALLSCSSIYRLDVRVDVSVKKIQELDSSLWTTIVCVGDIFNDSSVDIKKKYAQVLDLASNSQTLTSNHELPNFYRMILLRAKTEFSRNRLLTEGNLDLLISSLRSLFTVLKKSELFQSLSVVLESLFHFYFSISQFHQCTYLLKMIAPITNIIFAAADKREAFGLHFYISRLNFFDGEIEKTEEHLEEALKLVKSKKQLSKLFSFLIPVKLTLGKTVLPSIARECDLGDLGVMVQATIDGNIKIFDELLRKEAKKWIQTGVYFLLGECRSILLRNLFKKVWVLRGKPISLPLRDLSHAYTFSSGVLIPNQELVGIVSGLIFKDFIRGLIYPDKEILHLRKLPFTDL